MVVCLKKIYFLHFSKRVPKIVNHEQSVQIPWNDFGNLFFLRVPSTTAPFFHHASHNIPPWLCTVAFPEQKKGSSLRNDCGYATVSGNSSCLAVATSTPKLTAPNWFPFPHSTPFCDAAAVVALATVLYLWIFNDANESLIKFSFRDPHSLRGPKPQK